jgi:hypothetical protein
MTMQRQQKEHHHGHRKKENRTQETGNRKSLRRSRAACLPRFSRNLKPEATQAVTEPKNSKKGAKSFALMQRPEGATIEEMVQVISDWQSHTCAAASSPCRKRQERTSFLAKTH